jgi:hypothetical protein
LLLRADQAAKCAYSAHNCTAWSTRLVYGPRDATPTR